MGINNQKKVNVLSSEIGSRLRGLRIGKGLTQKELAAEIEDGVDYTYIGRIERGQQLPSLKVLQKISETFSVPIGYFFREESETIVYVNPPGELGEMARDEKGRDLLKALNLLHPTDIPIIVEIIHILSRHRDSAPFEGLGDSLPSPGEFLLTTKKKRIVSKGKCR